MSTRRRVLWLALCAGLALLAHGARAAEIPGKGTLELSLHGSRIEGTPLAWSQQNVLLLSRDGRLWDFAPQEAKEFRRVSNTFSSYPASVMQAQLMAELGKGFEVTGTGHYLVAHPVGENAWAQRFEDLYRNFVLYFSVRGFELEEPRFPLVAIVLKSHQDFVRYAARDGRQLPAGVIGYYSPLTNRVALFDQTGGSRGGDWSQNADTIIHEATHQTAFNTGLHQRFAPQPRWVVEGLATMFEASGVWNSRAHTRAGDRVNKGQLAQFRKFESSRPAGALASMLASDRGFEANPLAAYSEGWAWSYFLMEKEPRNYAKYLQRLMQIPDFTERTSAQRQADFTAVFGTYLRMLEARFARFMQEQR